MNESNERKSEKSTAVGRDEGRGNRRNAFIYKAQAPHSKNNVNGTHFRYKTIFVSIICCIIKFHKKNCIKLIA